MDKKKVNTGIILLVIGLFSTLLGFYIGIQPLCYGPTFNGFFYLIPIGVVLIILGISFIIASAIKK